MYTYWDWVAFLVYRNVKCNYMCTIYLLLYTSIWDVPIFVLRAYHHITISPCPDNKSLNQLQVLVCVRYWRLPLLNKQHPTFHRNRATDKSLTRFTSGVTSLNYNPFKQNRHPDDLCSHCNTPETITQIFTNCHHTNITQLHKSIPAEFHNNISLLLNQNNPPTSFRP